MSKTIYTMLISVWIITPIMMANVATTEPLNTESSTDENKIKEPLSADPTGISNWQVHSSCKSAMYSEEELEQQMGQFVCRMSQDMVYEQNNYEQRFTRIFKDDGFEDGLYFLEGISVTGCDISQMPRQDFTGFIISYFDEHEDKLEGSFFWTVERVIKPYCDKLKDASIEFHLDENDARRRT